HTHFKLNPNGDTLRLLSPELPRLSLDTVEFGEQGPDFSYGRQRDGNAWVWRYFSPPTPGSVNVASLITNKTAEVHFSVERGYYDSPFNLSLACETPGATIRYTTNGSLPVAPNGFVYSAPILINASRVIRAAASAPDRLPSQTRTHTYLYGLTTQRRSLPALSLVTATNHLFGRTGIMEYNPRNTDKHGPAWERPVSVEYIRPEDNGGFQVNAGVRIQGGGYIRGVYNYRTTSIPESKYSFRLYFRGEYGEGRLNYPLFPTTTVESFDTIVLRAGMNDPTNPFLKDEYARQLGADLGQPASHGTFVHLFLNGVYKGYYNPTERIDNDFLQAYHGGGERWDINAQFGEVREGDGSSWNQLLSLAQTRPATNAANFQEFARRVDLTNFVDYLLPNIYIDTDDWPHNNWRAAREATPEGRWRFYMWDAEFSFGQPSGHATTFNTINGQLSSLSPPWGTTEIQRLFNALKRSREFQMLFADRVHRAFFNDGPLTDARLRARYEETKARLNATRTVSGFNNSMINSWINGRRRSVLTHLNTARFNGSSNAPGFSQFGGPVPPGYSLVITNISGPIYYTTDGTDPRMAFTEGVAPSAQTYSAPLILTAPLRLKARSLVGTTNWSALAEATFQIAQASVPIRISELMYNPPGGDAYEFIELMNVGGIPVDLSGFSFEGVTFRFPVPFPALGPGARLVVASAGNPAAFSVRYPGLAIAGYYAGALSNGGERIALLDQDGRVIESVTYGDSGAWPTAADGGGASLERGALNGDPDSGASWHASRSTAGTPGTVNSSALSPAVRLNEVSAQPEPSLDWIELRNSGAQAVMLNGWSLTDDPREPRKFVFGSNSQISAGGFVLVYCDPATSVGGLKSSFGLDFGGEQVVLFDSNTNVVDVLAFGPQALGYTTGRIGPEGEWQLTEPTPAAANESAATGSLDAVVINEFLADSDAGDDWIELHNSASLPVTLTGTYLGTSNAFFRITAPTFIGPGGFAVVTADEQPGPSHVDFKLPAEGGMIALSDSSGRVLNRVDYPRQLPDVTSGRVPDATGSIVTLPFSATPGGSNYLAAPGSTLQLSEFMARNLTAVTAPGGGVADWIELHNAATNTLSLGGFTLRVDDDPRWTIPGNISLAPDGRLLIWATSRVLPSGNLNIGRELPDRGGVLTLSDDRGRLLDSISFGFQLPDRSVGRTPDTWMPLASPTPALPNGEPQVLGGSSTVRFNEWLVVSLNNGEWLELFNPEANPVNLGGHYLTDDPSASGLTQYLIAPLSFVPAGGFVRFFADGNPELGPDHLSFRLDQWGETIRLSNPATALIDQVDFVVQTPEVSEGRLPDGTSRITRLPWLSPLASNSRDDLDLDHDGLPDVWEFGFSLNPDDPADAALDTDGDGWTNAQEFAAGTNPQNDASFFEARSETEGAAVHIRFTAVANHTYSVLFRDGQLDSDTWQKLDDVPASVATREAVVTDLSPGAIRPVRFYRVVTPAVQ
ncbi:MAG TPA: hypothetical protein DCE44_20100, partial [Verrucomicrobiales bacterium]|nr:hypothetical protein [Verrucomicrobiales bacterium]